MRIIIELSEQEAQSATIRQGAGADAAQESQQQDMPTFDGGAPAEELVAGIEAASQAAPGTHNGTGPTDAGEPAGWLPIPVGEQSYH